MIARNKNEKTVKTEPKYKVKKKTIKKIITPENAMQRLVRGNIRFVEQRMEHSHEDNITRKILMKDGQHPIAVVISCSDSRVPPEVIFDHNLGLLFVIRNAGPVIGSDVIGSTEYAIDNLGTNLIVVMGHQKCGAVDATINHSKGNDKYIQGIVSRIAVSLNRVRDTINSSKENEVSNEQFAYKTTVENVNQCIKDLSGAPYINKMLKKKEIMIVAAYYNMETGYVEFMK